MKKVTKMIKNTTMGRMRQRFGQSQQWWAYYLDVSLAQVKMAESADRSLPFAASMKLGNLEILYVTTIEKDTTLQSISTTTSAPTAAPHHKLTKQATKMQYQAYTAQNKLAKMQMQHQQALNSLAMAKHLLLTLPDTETGTDDRLSLELLQQVAGQQTQLYGLEAQAYLQWKIDCYTYGAVRAKELATQNF